MRLLRLAAGATMLVSHAAPAAAQPSPTPPASAPPVVPAPQPPPATAPPDPGVPPVTPDPLATAKELNRQGVELLNAGEVERALDYFQQSRTAFPSSKNTANVAICLDRLGRHDEALEMYERLLTQYGAGLDDEDRAAIGPAMAALRTKVGSIAVSSNVEGRLVIDGRARGTLPMTSPVIVLRGTHVVRVIKDGYAPFEATVEVKAGEPLQLDAKLRALAGLGLLRVEGTSGRGADVFIDGVRVGSAPWEGTVGRGRHVVLLAKGDVGSSPTQVIVLEGQGALVRLEPAVLGASIRVVSEPPTASLEIDGVPVGVGAYVGRLPVGSHAIKASEAGYHPATAQITSIQGAAPITVPLRLVIDPDHPRWPKDDSGAFWVAAFGGYTAGSSLGSDAEAACPEDCVDDPGVGGFLVGARAGYRFPFGLSPELSAGYTRFGATFDRTVRDDGVTYDLHDEIVARGFFAAAGLSYRYLVGPVGLVARAEVGVLAAAATDPITGTARTTGEAGPIVLGDRSAVERAPTLLVAPALGAELPLGPVDVGLALALLILPTDGPSFAHDTFGPEPRPDPADPEAVGNKRLSDAIRDEQAYGQLQLWVPQISVGHTF